MKQEMIKNIFPLKMNPDNYFKRIFTLIYLNLFELICLNLFFVVSCVLIITIPSALIALTATILDISENTGSISLKVYWKTFFSFNQRWLISGSIYTIAFLLLMYGLIIYLSTETTAALFWFFCGFNILALALLTMVGFYFFPLLITTEFDFMTVWKHAFGMVVVEIKNSFALFISLFAVWFVVFRYIRTTWVMFVLIFFSLSTLLVVSVSRRLLGKYFRQFRIDASNE